MASEVPNNVGFGRSDGILYTLTTGMTSTERIDLGRPYAFIVLTCEDMSGINSNCALRLNISPEENIPMLNLYEQNEAATLWSKGNLPTSGTWMCMITHAFGARFVQPVLTVAADATITFKVWGYDPVVSGQPNR